MIHPNTELRFINDVIGYGVVATTLIPKGSITWCLDELDQILPPEKVSGMQAPYQDVLDKYAFRDKSGNFVLCWDNSRFINHSFRPNCLPAPYDLELAVRDIHPGEELLDHYGALNLLSPFRALPEPGVRRRIAYPDDLMRHHRSWDRQLKDAFECFNAVDQPLWSIVPAHYKEIVAAVASGSREMESCLQTWCAEAQMATASAHLSKKPDVIDISA